MSYELAFRGGEAANCSMDFFKEEIYHDVSASNRIEYNPVFSKTCQGGNRGLSNSKWLIRNTVNEDICPVRYLKLKFEECILKLIVFFLLILGYIKNYFQNKGKI